MRVLNNKVAAIVLAVCALILTSFAYSASMSITGQVVAVHDGDTITVLTPVRESHRVRLAQIDAPEKGQDFGAAAKRALSELVFGKTIVVEIETFDRYGRVVGRVLVDGKDINLEQVKAGMAWVYRQYAHDHAYFQAEEAARERKAGLWAKPNPCPPWNFRRNECAVNSAAETSSTARDGKEFMRKESETHTPPKQARNRSCGAKSRCVEMADCSEAKFYFEVCGVRRLDRDGDGIPCEKLCR